MANGLNKAMIIGRLGADPEIRYTPAGKAVANISVATKETWNKDGERQERTEWHKLVVWDKLAEICQQYLKKGDMAYFEGSLQTRKWQAQDGSDRYSTEIKVSSMQMLGSPGGETRKPQARPAAESAPASDDAGFDDIPF